MANFTKQHALMICELLTEQELEIIFYEGGKALEDMGISSASNPDGFFYDIAEAHAVASIVNPTHTIPDDLYNKVMAVVEKRRGQSL
jgi:hypothetical protein